MTLDKQRLVLDGKNSILIAARNKCLMPYSMCPFPSLLHRLALNLTLDEERLVQLLAGVQDPTAGLPGPLGPLAPGSTAATAAAAALAGSADIASRLLSCYGNLFTASLDQGGCAGGHGGTDTHTHSRRCRCRGVCSCSMRQHR